MVSLNIKESLRIEIAMATQVFKRLHRSSIRCKVHGLRRIALICLLWGWSAFWLVATLQSCCTFSGAAPHAVSAETVSQNTGCDQQGIADLHSPEFGAACCEMAIAPDAAFKTAVSTAGGEDRTHVYPMAAIQHGYAVRRPINAIVYAPLPPPRTPPFYLRTSRILV